MLSMDQQNDIRRRSIVHGQSVNQIAKEMQLNWRTVKKYVNAPMLQKTPFVSKRMSISKAYEQWVEELLIADSAVTRKKDRLTSVRIHALLTKGDEQKNLPPANLSIRTVERMVKRIRHNLRIQQEALYVDCVHPAGEAQLDFGEISLFFNGNTEKRFILILTFPHSNARFARVLPAQNFECVATGLADMFEIIKRVPREIRIDNMSSAISKIIRDDDPIEGCYQNNDQVRRLTLGFSRLMCHYQFQVQFCNPASGNEKGSVENAVGWFRRNFFVPAIRFDGDYEKLNSELLLFCLEQNNKAHYQIDNTINRLFEEDLAVMYELPDIRFNATTWIKAVVNKYGRVTVEKNEYAIDLPPKSTVNVLKSWNQLDFFDEDAQLIATYERCYEHAKSFIDWDLEIKLLIEKPRAFRHSNLASIMPQECRHYLLSLRPTERRALLGTIEQLLKQSIPLNEVLNRLLAAVINYEGGSVDDVQCILRRQGEYTLGSRGPLEIPQGLFIDMELPTVNAYATICASEGGYA